MLAIPRRYRHGASMRRFVVWVLICCAVAVLGSSSPLRDDPDFGTRPILLILKPVSTIGIVASNSIKVIGAWQVTSNDAGFGGISAMAIDKGSLIAVADTGSVIEVRPQFARRIASGEISGIASACGYDGQKTSRDTESLAIDPASGVRWIGFEWRNIICRIDPQQAAGTRVAAPPTMRNWPKTGGVEAMARLRDGRFVAIAERPFDQRQNSPAIIFDRDPVDPAAMIETRIFSPPQGFRPTDLAELPDGALVAAVRSFRPPFSFSGQLVRISREGLAKPLFSGATIARFESPMDENFEALAVTTSGKRNYIWAMSDDNFMPFQRTILVLLEYRG